MKGMWISKREVQSIVVMLREAGAPTPPPDTTLGVAMAMLTIPDQEAAEQPSSANCSDGECEDDMFLGGCPVCGESSDAFIWTSEHSSWLFCDKHRVCWSTGNCYGNPGPYTEEDFKRAADQLRGFTIVTPASNLSECAGWNRLERRRLSSNGAYIEEIKANREAPSNRTLAEEFLGGGSNVDGQSNPVIEL